MNKLIDILMLPLHVSKFCIVVDNDDKNIFMTNQLTKDKFRHVKFNCWNTIHVCLKIAVTEQKINQIFTTIFFHVTISQESRVYV